MGPASLCRNSAKRFASENSQAHHIVSSACDECQTRRRPTNEIKLGRSVAKTHRSAAVYEQIDPNILFLDELPKHKPFKPRVDIPVDVSEVISGFVLAKVREFDRSASSRGAAFSSRRAGEGPTSQNA